MTIWEYLIVRFDTSEGVWRPRIVNGVELKDWPQTGDVVTFCTKAGRDGWELVHVDIPIVWGPSASGPFSIGMQKLQSTEAAWRMFFKRPKE